MGGSLNGINQLDSSLSYNRNAHHFNTFKIGNNKSKMNIDSNNSYLDNYQPSLHNYSGSNNNIYSSLKNQ
jgi:hypothetical protein